MALRPAGADFVRNARALHAQGYRPASAGEFLAAVRNLDDRQHVDVGTWEVLTMMNLPVRGDVKAGNPSLRSIGYAAPAAPTGNGILSRVRGSFVAEACGKLKPPREAAQGEIAAVTMAVPDLGLVRFTFKANTYRHGRSRHWHWRAVRADLEY
jgi:hypothetical protein